MWVTLRRQRENRPLFSCLQRNEGNLPRIRTDRHRQLFHPFLPLDALGNVCVEDALEVRGHLRRLN